MTLDPDYETCLTRIEESPERGQEAALQWVAIGGGAPAQHCAAMADLALKNYRIGAARLLELADEEATREPLIAATLYGQAAEALLKLPDETTAAEAIRLGLEIAPEAADLHLITGRIHLSARRWEDAETAFSTAASFQTLDSDTFALRARTRIEQGKLEAATEDTLSALRLNPQNIAALVLRGELIQQGLTIDIPQKALSEDQPSVSKAKPERKLRGLR